MNDDIGKELTDLTKEVNPADMTERAYVGAGRLGLRRAVLGTAVVVALLGGGVAGAVTLLPTGSAEQPADDGDCATEEPSSGGDTTIPEEPSSGGDTTIPEESTDDDGAMSSEVPTITLEAEESSPDEEPSCEPSEEPSSTETEPSNEPTTDDDGDDSPSASTTDDDGTPSSPPPDDGDGDGSPSASTTDDGDTPEPTVTD